MPPALSPFSPAPNLFALQVPPRPHLRTEAEIRKAGAEQPRGHLQLPTWAPRRKAGPDEPEHTKAGIGLKPARPGL